MDGSKTLNVMNIDSPIAYTISRGSGGTLSMSGTNPNVNIISGNHAISTFITFASPNGSFNVKNTSSLVMSGTLIWSTSGTMNVETGASATISGPHTIAVQGRYAYIVNALNNKLSIFDVSNQLLRHSDRELFDRFLDVVRSWGTDPHENAPDRVQRVREDCRRFAEVLDRALDNVSKRAELKDYPLDEQRIREALARRLSGV